MEKTKINLGKRLTFLITFLFCLNLFLFRSFGPVRVAVTTVAFFFFLLLAFTNKAQLVKHWLAVVVMGAVVVILSVVPIFRDYGFVISLSGLGSLLSLVFIFYLFQTQNFTFRGFSEIFLAPLTVLKSYIFQSFKTPFRILKSAFSSNQNSNHQTFLSHSRVKSFIFTVIIGVPILGLLITLLANADPVFSYFVKKVITEEFLATLPLRLWITFWLFSFLLPLVFITYIKPLSSPGRLVSRFNLQKEVTIVMALVALVMATFLVVQWSYVFVNVARETSLSKFGVATYSEYVRKGFWELLQVSGLLYLLLWLMELVNRGENKQSKTVFNLVQIIIASEYVVFVISIFRRIWLYQSLHGWSLIRIYGGIFLLWLIFIVATLMLRRLWKRSWINIEVVGTILFLVIVGVFNAENFITTNHPPTVNGRVDYIYISRMSADSYTAWQKSFNHVKTVLTDPKFNDPNHFFTKKERREVAYSGMIIFNLLNSYDQLIRTYGTKEEMQSYVNILLAREEEMYSAMLTNYSYGEREDKESIQSNLETIKKVRQELKDKPNKYKETLSKLDLLYFNKAYDLDQFVFNNDWNTPLSFYSFDNAIFKPLSPVRDDDLAVKWNVDKVLVWNLSRTKAFDLMKKDISIEKLMDMERKYFDLFLRIGKQPENERDYEKDISTESPLL